MNKEVFEKIIESIAPMLHREEFEFIESIPQKHPELMEDIIEFIKVNDINCKKMFEETEDGDRAFECHQLLINEYLNLLGRKR